MIARDSGRHKWRLLREWLKASYERRSGRPICALDASRLGFPDQIHIPRLRESQLLFYERVTANPSRHRIIEFHWGIRTRTRIPRRSLGVGNYEQRLKKLPPVGEKVA
jgi:hypothetical protein